MLDKSKKVALAVASGAVVAAGAVGVADAGKQHTKKHSAAATQGSRGPAAETVLTGADAQSAKDAAVAAVPGGTVKRASIEDPSDASGAAYEVHVTKSDGSEVEVLLDSSFKVIKTQAGGHGHGH